MMVENLAQQLARVASEALRFEDDLLQEQIRRNPSVYPSDRSHPGILRSNDEHYYQFAVARHMVGTVPYEVRTEVNKQDLVLIDPKDQRHVVVVVEMKRWMSEKGDQELPGIKRDMLDKLPKAKADRKIMMIFSANPLGHPREENIGYLAKKLGTEMEEWEQSCFPTIGVKGEACSFWVATREVFSSKG